MDRPELADAATSPTKRLQMAPLLVRNEEATLEAQRPFRQIFPVRPEDAWRSVVAR